MVPDLTFTRTPVTIFMHIHLTTEKGMGKAETLNTVTTAQAKRILCCDAASFSLLVKSKTLTSIAKGRGLFLKKDVIAYNNKYFQITAAKKAFDVRIKYFRRTLSVDEAASCLSVSKAIITR